MYTRKNATILIIMSAILKICSSYDLFKVFWLSVEASQIRQMSTSAWIAFPQKLWIQVQGKSKYDPEYT